MDKKLVLNQLLSRLERKFELLVQAAQDAKEAATSEEAKAENKYDTRGLEASYLAGAQAQRALALKDSIHRLKVLPLAPAQKVQLSSLVTIQDEEEQVRRVFLIPSQGGESLDVDGELVQTITPEAPLAQKLSGLRQGDVFEFKFKGRVIEFEVLAID